MVEKGTILELNEELRVEEELEGGTEHLRPSKFCGFFQRPFPTLAKITVGARSNLKPVGGAMTRCLGLQRGSRGLQDRGKLAVTRLLTLLPAGFLFLKGNQG